MVFWILSLFKGDDTRYVGVGFLLWRSDIVRRFSLARWIIIFLRTFPKWELTNNFYNWTRFIVGRIKGIILVEVRPSPFAIRLWKNQFSNRRRRFHFLWGVEGGMWFRKKVIYILWSPRPCRSYFVLIYFTNCRVFQSFSSFNWFSPAPICSMRARIKMVFCRLIESI